VGAAALPRQLALLPLADDEAAQLLASIPEEDRDKCWWLVLRPGTKRVRQPGRGGHSRPVLELKNGVVSSENVPASGRASLLVFPS
jgi:hypothetical protein